jgi:hypothetical protein
MQIVKCNLIKKKIDVPMKKQRQTKIIKQQKAKTK